MSTISVAAHLYILKVLPCCCEQRVGTQGSPTVSGMLQPLKLVVRWWGLCSMPQQTNHLEEGCQIKRRHGCHVPPTFWGVFALHTPMYNIGCLTLCRIIFLGDRSIPQ